MNGKYKILIAEDEPPILDMVKKIIQTQCVGFEVCATAYNGRDALALISENKPDVVITDIKMPFMNGLELIDKVKQLNLCNNFIILSGYSKFEYARTALQLKVSEYLLKPINPENLVNLLDNIQTQLDEVKQNNEIEYLKQQLGLYYNSFPEIPDFNNKYLYLLFVYIGAISSRIYGELSYGSHYLCNLDYSKISGFLSGMGCKVRSFNGKYPNERIFAFIFDKSTDNLGTMTIERIFRYFQSDEMFVNLVVSDKITDTSEIKSKVKKLEQIITENLVFDKSQMFYESKKYTTEQKLISNVDKMKIDAILYYKNFDHFKMMLSNLISDFKSSDCTQIRLQTELQLLFSSIFDNLGDLDNKHFNLQAEVNEIIASSKNYSELNENICLKFKNFFMTEMQTSLQEGAKELIDRIENYIIENYNKNITYKTFYEMFGYNQIYITNLYKNEKGISPSKFITKLRIQKARELINLNPDIPLKEVAKMVGYDDPLYFSKVFKNFTGISPGKYISNHINYHENEP